MDLTVRVHVIADITKDLLHLEDISLDSGDFGDAGNYTLPVGETGQLHDHTDRSGNLTANARDGHRHSRHAQHLFKAGDGISRSVGVNSRHRPFVPGVHGLKHVKSLFATNFAENDPVRAHAQCILDEVPLFDLAISFDIGGRVSIRPTCGCCNCNSAASSMVINRSVSEMNADRAFNIVVLPVPVPPEIRVVNPRIDGGRQNFRHFLRQRPEVDKLVEAERLLGKFPDRNQRSVDCDWA